MQIIHVEKLKNGKKKYLIFYPSYFFSFTLFDIPVLYKCTEYKYIYCRRGKYSKNKETRYCIMHCHNV